MSDNRKKGRRRRSDDELPELTLIEKTIAKYLRFQCPTKKGILMGVQVVYFNGAKAVECLIESKWSSISTKALAGQTKGDSKDPICFSSRHDAVQMIRKFLDCEMFRRVVKVYKEDKPTKDKDTESNNAGDTSQSNTPRPVRQRKNKGAATVAETTAKDDESKEKDKTKKKKFKFELHEDQIFFDSPNDFYVWIYSPTTVKQYIMGALLVIGCIGVCLFPLWPPVVRTGVYYLSMVLASLLGVLLGLAALKYVIFAGVWMLTLGKIKFWLLPNLTEDVGFIESFIPLYTLAKTTDEKKKESSKKGNGDDDDADEKSKSKLTTNNDDDDEDEKKSSQNKGQTSKETEDDDEEKEKSSSRTSSIDDLDDGQKPAKSSDEDFEVLSKDELENK